MEERILRIFGNIEQICSVHTKLLHDLEASFDKKSPENSCVANAFIRNVCFFFNFLVFTCFNRI